MADEPTNGELGRLIEALRSEMREDLGALNTRLDRVVPLDVYTIEKTQMSKRIDALEAARTADAERLTATRRWMVGTVITVVVALLPYLGALVGGAGS
ncbi:hypothetical protein OG352_05120 [Streptomyces sp. NBC_01485]|uniref:hypothetical protein n=1 Tax=Streptomyces sp. NBC_01485 TaxID=2903884 RepID=UPI002E304F90|nr:hypothetical protein [Streptomyces sp. NBC_01485]